ncbi:MAG: hypothetical protein JO084_09415 [Bradyrhizobiaceae bacterium]|nr:hypothetical protein [Hyphomicrobiales bacterium]MBV9427931.1 hypothetical protein [Bradyrhizobiaceae bacterium]
MSVFFRFMAVIGLAAALFIWPSPGSARSTSVFANPYPCSVLSPHPCHPTFCSVFSRFPCQPDINYPFGQNLQLTIKTRAAEQPPPQHVADGSPPDDNAAADKTEDAPEHRLHTIGDMFAALRACWVPPAMDDSRHGTQLSVRLSFKRDGEPVGPPRVTYVSPGTPADVRKTYLDAVTASLKRCTPLPFSRGLGGALAGRPIAIRFVDDR